MSFFLFQTTVTSLWNSVHDGVQLGAAAAGIGVSIFAGAKALPVVKALFLSTREGNGGGNGSSVIALDTHRAVNDMHLDLKTTLTEQTAILRSIDGGIKQLADRRSGPRNA